jgi:hypothetical protein
MALNDLYTEAEAKDMLTLWKDAEKALASGTVKEYQIGTRKLTMLDMRTIRDQIRYYGGVLDGLRSNAAANSVRTVVIRD